MTDTKNSTERTGVEAALTVLRGAIDDLAAEGFTGPDLAQAFLELYVTAAGRSADRLEIAAHLADVARALRRNGKAQSQTPTESAHRVLSEAVEDLARSGQSDAMIRHHMLGYASSWIGKAEGPAGAEALYRFADAIVGRGRAACH